MIISRTPLRVSLVGGGSDLAAFYNEEPGAVITTAIRKYIYITVNRKFDSRIRASYAVTENVDSVEQLQHELIRECMRKLNIDGGIEITSISDIPSQGTGLGSSSSYTVGLLKALYAYSNRYVGAERLAREACGSRSTPCTSRSASRTSIAAYGGLRPSASTRTARSSSIRWSARRRRVTPSSRSCCSSTPASRARPTRSWPSRRTTSPTGAGAGLRRLVQLADELRRARPATTSRPSADPARELAGQEGDGQRRQQHADRRLGERARAAGATGGKITGAGGGGFLLFYAPLDKHRAIMDALPELRRVTFGLEPHGSNIIYIEESEVV